MRRRHRELTPRRTSSRIEHKRQLEVLSVEQEEYFLREDDVWSGQQIQEKDSLDQEQDRRELERQRAVEERSERARARNERLEAEDESEMDVDTRSMLEKMQKVLKSVKSHKDAWPFLKPVDDSYAPSYYHIIKEPMDISTMEDKVCQRLYKNQMEMENDFKKMVNNCEVYNGVGNAYTNMAFSLWRVFLKSVRKHFGETVSWPRLRTSGCMYIANSTNENHHIKIVIRSSPVGRRHKKKAKKKRKRPPGMKAIEALALAAEEALKNSNFEDDSTNDQVSSEFPGLKISTTQSHPASMLVKYSGRRKDSEESDSDGNSSNSVTSNAASDAWKERPAPNTKRKSVRAVVNGNARRRPGDVWRDPPQVGERQGHAKSSVPTAAARKMYEDSVPKKQMDFSVFDFVDETPPQPPKVKKPSAKVSPMPFTASRRRLSPRKDKLPEWNFLKPLTLQIPPVPNSQSLKSLDAFSFPDQVTAQGQLTDSICTSHCLDVSQSLYSSPYFAQPVVTQGKYEPCYNAGLHQHAVKL